MKKGYVCQKDNVIKNLTYLYFKNYPYNCTFIFSLITTIMEDIELYDKSSQILFSESIGLLAQKFSEKRKDDKKEHSNELKIILKHFMVAISTLEKSISDEYVSHFNQIIDIFCSNNFKIILDKELIECAISLGKFGQSFQNRKFSVYFCVSLIRISKKREEDIYNRVLFLAEDTERIVKFEMAYHIRFIIELNDSKFCQDKIINFLNYFLEDCDMNFLLITFQSIFYSNNLSKFDEEFSFKENLISKIYEIISTTDFSTLTYDFNLISSIFLSIFEYSYNNGKGDKDLTQIIKQYLKNFFNVRELKISTNVIVNFKIDYILQIFDKICFIFCREKDIQFLNEIFPIAMKYYFQEKENIDILYNILHLIICNIPNELLTKSFFNNILFFLEEENNACNSPNNNNNGLLSEINTASNSIKELSSSIMNSQNYLNNNKKEYKEIWLNNFDIIMKRMIEIENDTFIKCILTRFNSFLDIIKRNKEWRIGLKLFHSIQILPKYIMLKNIKYPNYEDYFQILFIFSKELLKSEKNILIEKEITLLLAELIHFSKSRNEILNYLKDNFLLNKSFYRRRIYCLFGDSAYEVFSKELIKKYEIYSNLFENILINDIPLMQSYIMNILLKYEIFEQDIINKVKSVLNSESKNDSLLNISLNKYLKISGTYKNIKNNNDEKKMDIENKIFEIEKIQKEKEKKEDNIFKKPIKPKSKISGIGYSSKKSSKLSSKILQKVDDKNGNRKSSMNTKEQENKLNENFHNSINNSSSNIPKIRKAGTNNYFNKNSGTPKNSNHKKI